mgnify:CR=1 FL=1
MELTMDLTGLIIGLGNPGPKYEGTRHNMGFMVLDLLCETPGAPDRTILERERVERGLCEVYRYHAPGITGRWYAVRPLTYMNRSGRAVVWAANYYKTDPENILVLHDELDLPLGKLKYKRGGGTAGHNGLKSIAELLGTREYPRLRLGIGKPDFRDTAGFVLSRFPGESHDLVRDILKHAAQSIPVFAARGVEAAMQEVNGIDLTPAPDPDQQGTDNPA